MEAVYGIKQLPRGTRFHVLAARVRRDVDQGLFPVGSRLPTVPELAAANGVGINTVRRAISELVAEGLLDRRQGAGTFVVATPKDKPPPRSIGVLVPSLTYYYPQVIAGIEHSASRGNAKLLIACSYYDIDREFTELQRLVDSGVDGLILVPSLHRSMDPAAHLRRLKGLSGRYIFVERRPEAAPGECTSYVCTDAMSGAYTAIEHLAKLGRRRIGFISHLPCASVVEVFGGYCRAMEELDLEIIDAAAVRKQSLSVGDVAAYVDVCRRYELDSVFCLSDPLAAALLGELRRDGCAVPEDVAVVGFDDEFARTAEVPLTAVSPPKFELGRLATEILLRQIALGDAAVPYQVQLRPRLIVRLSCGGTPTSTSDLVLEATG